MGLALPDTVSDVVTEPQEEADRDGLPLGDSVPDTVLQMVGDVVEDTEGDPEPDTVTVAVTDGLVVTEALLEPL